MGKLADSGLVRWSLWVAGFMVFAALAKRDASYDVVHYHIHNGWSALYGRLEYDLAPAGMHSFFNPLYNLGLYWLMERLPGVIVAGLLGFAPALVLPLLYYLTKALFRAAGAQASDLMILAIAVCGFFAGIHFSTLVSVRNDSIWAAALILGVFLLVQPWPRAPGLGRFAAASLIVGAAMGFKLTNLPYVAGFAVAALISAPDWRARLHAGLVCAVGGAAGVMLTGGWWHFKLWRLFGNPVFPMANGVFGAPLGSDHSFSDPRYLPEGVLDGLFRPFLFLFDGMLINEAHIFDVRFLLGYIAIFALIGLGVAAWRTGVPAPPRPFWSVGLGLLTAILVWTFMFSIQRYMTAAWILGPVFAFTLAAWRWKDLFSAPRLRLYMLAVLGLILMSTTQDWVRRVGWSDWTEGYVEVSRPAQFEYDNSMILMTGPHPSAFTAIAFPEARIAHAASQPWSRPALENYDPLIKAAIEAHSGPFYAILLGHADGVVVTPPERADEYVLDGLDELDSLVGLSGNPARCERVETNLDSMSERWFICPLERIG